MEEGQTQILILLATSSKYVEVLAITNQSNLFIVIGFLIAELAQKDASENYVKFSNDFNNNESNNVRIKCHISNNNNIDSIYHLDRVINITKPLTQEVFELGASKLVVIKSSLC